MTKIVINRAWGGYALEPEHYEYLGIPWDGHGRHMEHDRANPDLVRCIEALADSLSGKTDLRVIEIPDEVSWSIVDCEGREGVRYPHPWEKAWVTVELTDPEELEFYRECLLANADPRILEFFPRNLKATSQKLEGDDD